MSDTHRTIFQVGDVYRTARETKAGFRLDQIVKPGVDLVFSDTKYSPYDSSYVYYFLTGDGIDPIEVWIHEDTAPEEIKAMFVKR